jgi:hypothetical protein
VNATGTETVTGEKINASVATVSTNALVPNTRQNNGSELTRPNTR